MIWTGIALLLLVTLLMLLRRPNQSDLVSTRDSALAHFREQLAALEADQKNGKISPEDYQINKAEISRNLLRESQQSEEDGANSPAATDLSLKHLGVIVSFVTLCALGLYSVVGRPTLKAAPPQSKEAKLDQTITGTKVTVRQALTRMEADLAKDPNKVEALALYANTQLQLEEYQKARTTYRHLQSLQPETAQWHIGEIEAVMGHAEGQISPAVDLLVDIFMRRFPANPAGPYLKGLGYEQRGKNDEAITVWEAFVSSSPKDAPWMRSFMPKIRALKYPMPEVSAEAMQQVMAMSEAERKAFFTEMGNRLEARIADIPDYPEAWMRLARVRLMTGDRDAVLKALQKGIDGSSDPAQAVPLRQMLDKLKNSADN